MTTDRYRYQFGPAIPVAEVETTLLLSVFGVEALHGESQTRLDAGHAFDARARTVAIDASTPVGRDLNRLFVGFLTREFGSGGFRVERIEHPPEPAPRPAPVTA
ncbi:hypothetical protein R5W23_004892 [Gemmata sp. JC673]|uniref:DUF3467 domain-containing protein n=1 Tax=Gemmata algarum TaxID=2975278 RepID=A0ABU5F863_9BACT|nr:hypothetical protein [Gemmata algarum]MDY3563389.1 hypothetical protein [Gemmata algarum]